MSGAVTNQVTSHDGHARIDPTARLDGSKLRFSVTCPTGGELSCQGNAEVRGPLRNGRRARLARASFHGLRPGDHKRFAVPVKRSIRHRLRRGSSAAGLGVVQNQLESGMVRTLNRVKISFR
ncbi:MAG: hypothetical protein M3O90_09000 [Actinomycetota bacterium]|nr:hypothetical protein [Actinomycetota bacterium]